jgi:diaminohydroxyphosphoribosylaminopyrimidine deaminase/5-amino-6-(5-phosphoribosylamino)uracil reductase
MPSATFDAAMMRRAIELAGRGEGHVEPNPLVGAVLVAAGDEGPVLAEAWHAAFGGPHAEAAALAAAGAAARGGTLYVTLEPCCHHGKTPPCTEAIIRSGVSRVVVAAEDPFPEVAGGGFAALRQAGIVVEQGLLAAEARRLTAPFRKLITTGKPWVIAKWAMSLDGHLAARPGEERWISSPESRALVHALRGRCDAIAVGIGTVLADDPLLTPRPAGIRRPLRIVVDSQARLPLDTALVKTAGDAAVLVAVGPEAAADRTAALRAAGCEIWHGQSADPCERLTGLLRELGTRRLTNLLVEGGPTVLTTLFAAGEVDEVWTFVAPKLLGTSAGQADASSLPRMTDAPPLEIEDVSHPGGDIFIRGLVQQRTAARSPTEA